MSGSLPRRLALFLAVVASPALCRADDLDRARNAQEIAAQKASEDVRSTLAEARKLEQSNPAEAARLLKKCLSSVQDDPDLSDTQRTSLIRQLRNALRNLDETARSGRTSDSAAAPPVDRRPREERPVGSDTAKTARDLHDAARSRVAESGRLKTAKEAANSAAMRGTDEAAIPTDKPIVFASSYAYRAAQRGKPQLTDKEKTLIKALNSVLSVDYDKKPLKDVIADLNERTGQAIVIDEQTLKEANIEYDDPVTFKAKKVTFRTVLKKILGDRGLTFIIQEGTIQVMTTQRAREHLVTRAYPIGDLATAMDMRFPPLLRRLQMLQNVGQLIDLIQNNVDPQSWQVNGGPGTISFYEPTMSLVIRQTAEMHYQLGGALGR
jgi:hypothetical protein